MQDHLKADSCTLSEIIKFRQQEGTRGRFRICQKTTQISNTLWVWNRLGREPKWGKCLMLLFTLWVNSRGITVYIGNYKIGGGALAHLVDTGASINVLDQASYNNLNEKPRLVQCNTRYYGYACATHIHVKGQFNARLSFKGTTVTSSYIVVDGSAGCLLSYHTANSLGIIGMLNIISPK